MFGLDEVIAELASGGSLLVILGVAALLGLRHATDPDHVAAVSTLVAGNRAGTGTASRMGLAWGAGHGASLMVFGLPIVLFGAFLPETLQIGAETLVGVLIMALAIRVLIRWRRGRLMPTDVDRARSPRQAFGLGLVHGMGGSAGVGVLLLATIEQPALGALALGLFAVCSAVSMTMATGSLGFALSRDSVVRGWHTVAPAMGVASLAFGAWYVLGALAVVPYGL